MSIKFLNTSNFPDNVKLTFGDGADIEIYSDNTTAYIEMPNLLNFTIGDSTSYNTPNIALVRVGTQTGTKSIEEDWMGMYTDADTGSSYMTSSGATRFNTTNNGVAVTGNATISTISNASSDTDKFLVSDSGEVKYRTGAQVRSDIGAGTGSGSVTSVATTSPVLGGTITGSGTISLLKPANGDWWNGGVTIVGTDGVMEIGKYIDFHASDTATSDFDIRLTATTGSLNVSGDIVIGGGDITLGGTGRIQGIDTVSSGTDAANKAYVDAHVSGVTSVAVTVGTGLDVSGSPITSSGTIDIDLDLTELTLGSGLDSTATGLSLDLSEFTDMTAAMVGTDEFIVLDSSAERRKAANEIGLSIFDNDAGFTTNTGTVTGTGGANRIAYWSSGTALTNDSKFTFNGTTLGLTGSNAVLNIGSGGAGTTSLFAWTGDTFYIQQDSASGNIQIETDDFIVKNHGASETYIRAQDNSSVELYHNNVKKFETTSVGITVTGEITSSSVAYAPFSINRGVQNNPFGNNPGNAIKLFNLVGSSSMGSAPSSAGGDTYWVAPGAGRIRSITIRNVKDTPTSGNTRFKIYKNGANLYTSSYITPTSGGSVGQSVQLNDIDHSFANLDRIQIGFQGETSTTNWGSCALTVVYELSDYSFN